MGKKSTEVCYMIKVSKTNKSKIKQKERQRQSVDSIPTNHDIY